MAEAPNLGLAMGLPPERAVEYFRSKGYELSWNWHDLDGLAHARAFTVAKAMRLEILHDIRQAVDRALVEGQTLAQFRRDLEPRLKARGWWGRQIIVDSQGNAQRVELGSPWRLKTIYQTNMQTAFMAGRYQEFVANAARRPYWQYIAVMDDKTRPSHRSLHQAVFRWDDPFWKSFYPPNGFNCRCRVRALSERDLQRFGLKVRDSTRQLGERWVVEQSSGVTMPVATYRGPGMARAVSPDMGWSYNPGEAWSRWDAARARPDVPATAPATPEVIRATPEQPNWRSYRRPDLREVPGTSRPTSPELVPAAASAEAAHQALAAELGVSAQVPLRVVETPVDRVAIRYDLLGHLVEKRSDARERYARFILPTLSQPFEVWLTRYEDGYRKRYIGLFGGRNDLAVIVRENRDGSLMWNVMHARDKDMNKFREGALLFGAEIQ